MNIVLAVTGATGAYAAQLLIQKSSWPVTLVMSVNGKLVYEKECGNVANLETRADKIFADSDLAAPISSGSVPTAGMVVLPCSVNTLAKVASGITDTLITRAAHCHLKERRKLVLCVRESPWTLIDFRNAARITAAGGTVMPMSPPYYMFAGQLATEVTMHDILNAFVDRVLDQFGQRPTETWDTVR